jgi:hypothetical protein
VQANVIISPALLPINPENDEACRQQAASKFLPGNVSGAEASGNAVCYRLQSRYLTAKTITPDGARQFACAG